MLVSEGENRKLAQALDMGVNDYLMRPVDRNELMARVKTQLRKKRYADKLRHNMQLSLEMAITDQLTGLHNRRYMTAKAMRGDREKCIEAGANDYIAKPVEVERLLSLMRVWLSK